MFQWRAHALHNDCVTLTNVDSRQLLVIGKYLIYIFVVRHTPWIKVLNEEIPARDLKFAWLALQPDTVATAREINKYTHTKQKQPHKLAVFFLGSGRFCVCLQLHSRSFRGYGLIRCILILGFKILAHGSARAVKQDCLDIEGWPSDFHESEPWISRWNYVTVWQAPWIGRPVLISRCFGNLSTRVTRRKVVRFGATRPWGRGSTAWGAGIWCVGGPRRRAPSSDCSTPWKRRTFT